jgi:hypothetical protein
MWRAIAFNEFVKRMKHKLWSLSFFTVFILLSCGPVPLHHLGMRNYFPAFMNPDNWYILQVDTNSKGVTQTFFAGGLVCDFFQSINIDAQGIFLGTAESNSTTRGYSYLLLEHIDDPQGHVVNFTSTSSFGGWNTVTGCFYGSDGKLYSLLMDNAANDPQLSGGDMRAVILEAATKVEKASFPYWLRRSSGQFHRMAVDGVGNIWAIGGPTAEPEEYGICRISSNFSSCSLVENLSYNEGDTAKCMMTAIGEVWIVTEERVFQVNSSGVLSEVTSTPFHTAANEDYNMFRYAGSTYAIGGDPLSIYSVSGTTFTPVCLFSASIYDGMGFEYGGLYYFPNGEAFNGTTVNTESFPFAGGSFQTEDSGYYVYSIDGSTLLQVYPTEHSSSVAARVFKDGLIYELSAANTSEGLIQNNILGLMLDNTKLYTSFPAKAYNILDTAALTFQSHETSQYIVDFHHWNNKIYAGADEGLFDITGVEQLITDYAGFDFVGKFSGGVGVEWGNWMSFDRNHLWVATDNTTDGVGLALIDIETGVITHSAGWGPGLASGYRIMDITRIPEKNSMLFVAADEVAMTGKLIRYDYDTQNWSDFSVPPESSGYHWLSIGATADGGLYLFDCDWDEVFVRRGSEWESIAKRTGYWSNRITVSFCKLKDFLLMYGGAGGFAVFDLKNNRHTVFTSADCSIPSDRINEIEIEDLGGDNYRIWFGTDSALCYMESHLSEWY